MVGIVIGVISMAAWGLALSTGIPDAAGVIHACFNPTGGAVRLVELSGKCTASEQPVSWNQAGVDVTPQISIVLGPNGNILRGTGFTSTRDGEGAYQLVFEPGTFEPESFPAPNITTVFNFNFDLIVTTGGLFVLPDGSGRLQILVQDTRQQVLVDSGLSINITK